MPSAAPPLALRYDTDRHEPAGPSTLTSILTYAPTAGDAGGAGPDATALDDTSCDELAGLRLCAPFDTGSSLPTVNAAAPNTLEDNAPYVGVIFGMTSDGKPDLSYTATGSGVGPDLMPRDRWICVQVHTVVDATSGLAESWIDGVPSGRLDALPTLPGKGYNNVHAGHFSGGPMHTEVAGVWTDELAVGTLPIPCD